MFGLLFTQNSKMSGYELKEYLKKFKFKLKSCVFQKFVVGKKLNLSVFFLLIHSLSISSCAQTNPIKSDK